MDHGAPLPVPGVGIPLLLPFLLCPNLEDFIHCLAWISPGHGVLPLQAVGEAGVCPPNTVRPGCGWQGAEASRSLVGRKLCLQTPQARATGCGKPSSQGPQPQTS